MTSELGRHPERASRLVLAVCLWAVFCVLLPFRAAYHDEHTPEPRQVQNQNQTSRSFETPGPGDNSSTALPRGTLLSLVFPMAARMMSSRSAPKKQPVVIDLGR